MGGGTGEVRRLFWRSRRHLRWLPKPQTQSHLSSLSYYNPRNPISPSSPPNTLPHPRSPTSQRSLTVVLGSCSPYCQLVSIVSGYLRPGHSGVFSTHPLIQDSTSVCSLDTNVFHHLIDGVAARFVHLVKAFNKSERPFHPITLQCRAAFCV